jgi:hypothetical protein
MSAPKVKLTLRKLDHEVMCKLLEETVLITPVAHWELESYIISDLFVKKMAFFKILPERKKYKIKLTLTMIQAIAINNYFAATSDLYNVWLRMKIEPFLIMSNSLPNDTITHNNSHHHSSSVHVANVLTQPGVHHAQSHTQEA